MNKIQRTSKLNGRNYSVREFAFTSVTFDGLEDKVSYMVSFDDEHSDKGKLMQCTGSGETIEEAINDFTEKYDQVQESSTPLKDGIKETRLSYLVDLDKYSGRTRYYTGTRYNQCLSINKETYPDLLEDGYNDLYNTELDVIIAKYHDGVEMKGVKLYRKGAVIL